MVLIERQEALDLLNTTLDTCATGTGLVTMISGPVGSGKTELIRQFAQQALKSGATFLDATASRAESTLMFGVVSQLFAGAKLPVEQAERATRLIEDGMLTATLLDGPGAGTAASAPLGSMFSGLTRILLDLASDSPLLLVVDDTHLADVASLQFLLYLARRIGQARMLVVLSEALRPSPHYSAFQADLASQFNYHHVRLKLLSLEGVTAVLNQHLPHNEPLAPAYHHISGGSPSLLNALIQDHKRLAIRSHTAEEVTSPIVGEAFGQAVLSCLYRSAGYLLRLAQVLAVLGTAGSTLPLISEILGLDAASTGVALAAATEIGLLDRWQLRHTRARAAVLDALTVEDRAALHERTASALHADGASPVVVAQHVIAANVPDATPFASTLVEAAENALESDDTALALACCRMAERVRATEEERNALKALRARIQFRVVPSAAERTLLELSSAARSGKLAARNALPLIGCLLWHGQPEEAAELLERLGSDTHDEDIKAGLYLLQLQACYLYPSLTARLRPRASVPGTDTTHGRRSLRLQIATVIEALLADELTTEVSAEAQHILQTNRLDDTTSVLSLAYLDRLIVSQQLETAAIWCGMLLEQAERRRMPVWQAMYRAIRALIQLRQGSLAAAEKSARSALVLLPADGWGVMLGMPLSVLLQTAGRTGEPHSLPQSSLHMPQSLQETRFGLYYLRARGRFNLNRGNTHAAMKDFDTCREILAEWGLDLPNLVPWRVDMAEAMLHLGQPVRARELVGKHLSQLDPIAESAPTCTPDAAAELDRVLAGLDPANDHRVGQDEPWPATAAEPSRLPAPHSRGIGDLHIITDLSRAELKVATLAARGHTNRQIASLLFVTVSTVEQHLTHVYRKLRVQRRTDLHRVIPSMEKSL
jgi:DNA-binding CsgD family transcriptional regulator/tetratricopeptide (TPR) repeat protein